MKLILEFDKDEDLDRFFKVVGSEIAEEIIYHEKYQKEKHPIYHKSYNELAKELSAKHKQKVNDQIFEDFKEDNN